MRLYVLCVFCAIFGQTMQSIVIHEQISVLWFTVPFCVIIIIFGDELTRWVGKSTPQTEVKDERPSR